MVVPLAKVLSKFTNLFLIRRRFLKTTNATLSGKTTFPYYVNVLLLPTSDKVWIFLYPTVWPGISHENRMTLKLEIAETHSHGRNLPSKQTLAKR